MKRRDFFEKSMIIGGLAGPITAASSIDLPGMDSGNRRAYSNNETEVIIERSSEGLPHQGKVLAVIQPHCDDIAFFAAGTVAKLLQEGYTGYLIRTSNDEAAGSGNSTGERVLNNERSNQAFAESLGSL
jgi:hypothetical protein